MIHELKIYPKYFNKVISGEKTFEIRKNDRNFRVGDYIALNEYALENGYTGRSALYRVEHITTAEQFPEGLVDGYVVLGICPCVFHDKNIMQSITVTAPYASADDRFFEEETK